MKSYDGIYDAKNDLMRYLMAHGSKLPEETSEAVTIALNEPSPLDAVIHAAEALYAAREKLNNEGREIVAGTMNFVSAGDLHGYHSNGRGRAIALAMMRDGGEKAPLGLKYPAKKDDPEVTPQFQPKPDPEAIAPAPADPGK